MTIWEKERPGELVIPFELNELVIDFRAPLANFPKEIILISRNMGEVLKTSGTDSLVLKSKVMS